jgi:DNA-binding NtrC family response regulator
MDDDCKTEGNLACSGLQHGTFAFNSVIASFPGPQKGSSGRRTGLPPGARPRAHFAGMVGASDAMQQVYSQIERVGPTDSTVTIVGASGTGKELAARALHDLGPRHHAPFVAVNCGAIPANLAEAEFFGFEKGAFTGAQRQHAGLFERANDGTLFLDEVTEMPVELQVKLLRVLESGCVVRVGGAAETPVDVRVLAATNREPLQAVLEGRLREDLYYRLAVFVLRLPALSERGDDVLLVAQDVLDALNERYGTAKAFSERALATLRCATWPGNVRELRNCVERAYILSETEVDLERPSREFARPIRVEPDGCLRVPLGTTVEEAERELILATIHHCRGNKRKAAEELGVSLKTIYNKLAEYRPPQAA